MRRLPPLTAIEAFVQVARLGSVKAAAEELAVSSPALSRRVLIVSGRDLHWYGVHMVRGLKSLADRMGKVRAALL